MAPTNRQQEITKGFKLGTKIIVSFVVLGLAIYVIVDDSDQGSKEWAYGAIGIVTGYWLK